MLPAGFACVTTAGLTWLTAPVQRLPSFWRATDDQVCLFTDQSGSVISYPACSALHSSSTARHHRPISASDEKEPELLDDDIESHLEIKAVLCH